MTSDSDAFAAASSSAESSTSGTKSGSVLTPRWYKLTPHPKQIALAQSKSRFIIVVAGRRSGKTEIGKRAIVKEALSTKLNNWWGVLAAPTRDQAKRIFWNDLKALSPRWSLARKPMEAELTIQYITGAEISVVGMDKPDRIEGKPLDFFWGDEYGNMKESAWGENIRPALSTIGRPGKARFSGVPEGRNHFYRMFQYAQSKQSDAWEAYHWASEEVLGLTEQGRTDLAEARATLDPVTYDQEYNANFVNFEGRVYHAFDRETHAKERIPYNAALPLIFCFDFNNAPGIAAVCQEINHPIHGAITAAIGQVWIPTNSNTVLVSKKLAYDWAHHQGPVLVYGDATGGAKTTTAISGSDWDLVYEVLKPIFKDRLKIRVGKHNPLERVRVNAVNSRLKTADGKIHAIFDPVNASQLIEDLDSVTMVEGGSGEIDKHSDKERTHISDAFGYYIAARFPVQSGTASVETLY